MKILQPLCKRSVSAKKQTRSFPGKQRGNKFQRNDSLCSTRGSVPLSQHRYRISDESQIIVRNTGVISRANLHYERQPARKGAFITRFAMNSRILLYLLPATTILANENFTEFSPLAKSNGNFTCRHDFAVSSVFLRFFVRWSGRVLH